MRFVELFAGIGGLGLGLQQAGMQLVTGYEHWDKALDIWQSNSKIKAFQVDLGNVSEASLHIMQANPAMIAGGPPCQDYSAAGKRILGKNAALTQAFAMIIAIVRPEWFIYENVRKAPLTRNYRTMRRILKRAGYGLTETKEYASLHGTPQKRERFFCIGRLGETDRFLESAIVAARARAPKSVRSILDPKFPDDAELIRRTAYFVRPYTGGQGVHPLDGPAPTIIRSSTGKPNKTYRDNPHPKDPVPYDKAWQLTEHQAMRIQGFPPDFDMGGMRLREKGKPYSQRDRMQMIANAVPPPLAESIGEVIMARHAGHSIPALAPGFDESILAMYRQRYVEKHNCEEPEDTDLWKKYAAQVANIKSRVNRARRILRGRTYADLAQEIAALEAEPAFQELDVRQKSDLRVAIRLYHDHVEKQPPSKYELVATRVSFRHRPPSETPVQPPRPNRPLQGGMPTLNAGQIEEFDYDLPDDPRDAPEYRETDGERLDADSFNDRDE